MRIIAGEFRGRRLVAPRGLATRPTTDRVREAWFSILGPLSGTVLDLYAGTGALGLEALSRGAKHAIFVESARAAQKVIEKNAETLGVSSRITLVGSSVEAALRLIRGRAPYDLVVTDPPWTHMNSAELTLKRLLTADLLTEDGIVALGHPKGRPVQLSEGSGLVEQSQRSWGDSAATFFIRLTPAH